MWYSSFRSKYKIQPMEKFSGEGSFLFQNDSEPDLWGARFAKQGQVLQVRSISRPLRPPRNWPPTKVCPENWNFKGWGQQIYFFYKLDPEQPESWLESLGSVRGSCGLEQEMRFAEVGKKSSEAESRQWSQVRGAWWRWRRESGTPWQLCREHRAGFNLNNMQVVTKPTNH